MPIVIVARYSIVCLAIMIRYNAYYTRRYTDSDCLREHVRLFVVLQKVQMQLWLTITNNGDNVLSRVRLLLNLANQNNVDTPKHNNESLAIRIFHWLMCRYITTPNQCRRRMVVIEREEKTRHVRSPTRWPLKICG